MTFQEYQRKQASVRNRAVALQLLAVGALSVPVLFICYAMGMALTI